MLPISPVLPSSPRLYETVIARTQEQYLPLPAIISKGVVTTRWHLSISERLRVLWHGSVYLQVWARDQRLQPLKMTAEEPAV